MQTGPSKQAKQPLMQRIMERETAPEWSLGLAIFFMVAYLVLWVAGQFAVVTLGAGLPAPDDSNYALALSGALVIGALIASLAVILGVMQWARRRSSARWIDALGLQQPRNPSVFLVILVGLAAAWTIDLIGVLLRLKSDQIIPPSLAALQQPIGVVWVVAAIFAIVIQPLAEGLVFSGILYPALARDVGNNLWACLLVAVIYAVANAAILAGGTGGAWFALLQPFLMALVVALVRAYSKSTYSAIVTRAVFGLFFVLAAIISARF